MEKNEVELIEKDIGNVVEIEESKKIWQMPKVMADDYASLGEYVRKKGARIMNAPYARYVDIDWEEQMSKGVLGRLLEIFTQDWHFHVGLAVDSELGGEGRIKPGCIAKRKYVEKIHCGPYKKVGDTYREMYEWAVKQGVALDGESFEFYINDPSMTDSSELKTMVLIPVKE